MSTRAQLATLLATKVLSGGSDTTALGLREYEQEAIDSNVNKSDDLNVTGGYMGADIADGKIYIGNASNLGIAVTPSGEVTMTNAGVFTLLASAVISKALTGYTSGPGSITAADTILSAIQKLNGNNALKPLFNSITDVGNINLLETDLISNSIAAGQLVSNNDKIISEYGGTFVSSGTATRQIRIYFGGTVIFDTGALTLSLSSAWVVNCTIIRKSATEIRYMVSFVTEGAALSAYTSVGEVTGLTLSNANTLKVTGEAAAVGAATDDIVLKLSQVNYLKAA